MKNGNFKFAADSPVQSYKSSESNVSKRGSPKSKRSSNEPLGLNRPKGLRHLLQFNSKPNKMAQDQRSPSAGQNLEADSVEVELHRVLYVRRVSGLQQRR